MMMAWLGAQYFNGARIELSGMMFFLQVRAGNFCRRNASVVKHLFLDDSTLFKCVYSGRVQWNQLIRRLVRRDASSLNTEGFTEHSTCGGSVAIEEEINLARQERIQLHADNLGNGSRNLLI